MKKMKIMALVLAAGLFAAGCSAETETASNGGVATAEQIEAATSELGTEIIDLKFSLNGTTYQYPFTVQTMLDDGWKVDESVASELETMPANTISTTFSLEKKGDSNYGKAICYATVSNATATDIPLGQLEFDTLEISKEYGSTLILPQGITWESTYDEVVAAYQPSDDAIVDEADVDMLYFVLMNEENGKCIYLYFDTETRTLSKVLYN